MITRRNFIVPIYEYKVNVVIFDDINEVKNRYPDLDDCYGATMQFTDGSIVLLNNNNDIVYTIVHECEHVKNAIWNFIGYTPQASNDEVDAYLTSYLFSELMKAKEKHQAAK